MTTPTQKPVLPEEVNERFDEFFSEYEVTHEDLLTEFKRFLAQELTTARAEERPRVSTDKVTRVEVIDHTKDLEDGGGRAYVKWEDNIKVETALQDQGRTLKIFITLTSQGASHE